MTDPIRAEDVEPERVEWLWRERIPRGMFSVVAGRPDQGKGLFCAHLAADVSRNGGKVLYSAIEDSHGLMTRPRLEAAGANLKNVLLWRFQLMTQFEELREIMMDKQIDLIVIDPLASHLERGISRHSDQIRLMTDPMSRLLEETNAACVVTDHVLKRVGNNAHPLAAIGGSGSGMPAVARMAFLFGVDPSDADCRILACVKANIRDRPAAIAFEVDSVDIEEVGEVPSLVYDKEVVFDPMRLVISEAKSNVIGRPPDKRAAAAEWLTNYLHAAGGPVQAGVVKEDAKQFGMTTKTLRRAATDMGMVINPPGGGRNCTWDLPDEIKSLLNGDSDESDEAIEDIAENMPLEHLSDEDLAAFIAGDDDEREDGADGDVS